MTNTDLIYTLIAIVVPLVELLGILAAVHAIMNARTSQGAIAWAISLITFPWLALILYAILGRNKFKGYVLLRSAKDQNIHHYIEKIQKYDSSFIKKFEDMLTADFSRSRPVTIEDYTRKSFFFKLAVRSARLLAPIL